MTDRPPHHPVTIAAEFTAGPDDAGHRLDQVLAARVDGLSRGAARRALSDGAVFVDDHRIRIASRAVQAGQRIRISGGPRPAVPLLRIIHEDSALIVLDKPAGVPVQPTRRSGRGCLLDAVRAHRQAALGPEAYVGLLHRIDRDTSGLVLFSTDRRANHSLARGFAEHSIDRAYDALVHGTLDKNAGTLDGPIGRADGRGRRCINPLNGKAATTHFEVLARWDGVTRLRLRLETGRTHQIRVHLAEAGHPVVGDRQYGRGHRPVGPHAAALGAFPRQALHAGRLALPHPLGGDPLELESPLPADLQELVDQMETG